MYLKSYIYPWVCIEAYIYSWINILKPISTPGYIKKNLYPPLDEYYNLYLPLVCISKHISTLGYVLKPISTPG